MFPLFAKSSGKEIGPTLTYLNTLAITSAGGSSKDMGSITVPRAGLLIAAVFVTGTATRVITSVSIGGTNGQLLAGPSHVIKRGFAWRQVSAGSHSITVTLDGTNGLSSLPWNVSVYLLENNSSDTPISYVLPDTATLSGSPQTLTLSGILRGSCGIFGAAIEADRNIAYSSANIDYNTVGGSTRVVLGSKVGMSVGTHIESVTKTSGADGASLSAIAAAWR